MADIRVQELMDVMEELAPKSLAEDYDNVGLLLGSKDKKVSKVIMGLELSESLLKEAIEKSCDLIIVHHPLIFRPIKKIVNDDITGNKIIRLIQKDISLYVAHTNLDTSIGGLNDFVAAKLGVGNLIRQVNRNSFDNMAANRFEENKDIPNYRVGYIEEKCLFDFVKHIKEKLDLSYIHYTGDDDVLINKIAICTGSGMSFYKEAIKEEIDVYITGDMKYHDATLSIETGIPIIDATHYGSEILVSELFRETIHAVFPDLKLIIHEGYDNPIKTL